MSLDEETVQQALQELKELHLVRFVLPSHGKSVTRYRHVLDEAYGLDRARLALLAVLLLRGPQTPGELRSRSGRLAEFDSPAAVQGELEVLAAQPEPLVRLLARQPGQKEDRWQQLLAVEVGGPTPSSGPGHRDGASGSPGVPGWPGPADTGAPAGHRPADPVGDPTVVGTRVEELEAEVRTLRLEVDQLAASLAALRHSLGE